jgi:hypothetical protein
MTEICSVLSFYGSNVQENQAIDPDFMAMNAGKIAFRPKRKQRVFSNTKAVRKKSDVIDPLDRTMDPGKI